MAPLCLRTRLASLLFKCLDPSLLMIQPLAWPTVETMANNIIRHKYFDDIHVHVCTSFKVHSLCIIKLFTKSSLVMTPKSHVLCENPCFMVKSFKFYLISEAHTCEDKCKKKKQKQKQKQKHYV